MIAKGSDRLVSPANADKRVASVEFTEGSLIVGLMGGRRVSVPLEW